MPPEVGALILCVGVGLMFPMPWARRFNARAMKLKESAGERRLLLPSWAVAAIAVLIIAGGLALSLVR